MDKTTANRLLALYERAHQDAEYQALQAELHALDGQLLHLFTQLPGEQLDMLTDYLGLIHRSNLRLLVIACADEGPT